jgi:uncharacterized protein
MDTPQEVEVWLILPALRKQFVVALKMQGMKQKDVAQMMGLTQAAISQYMNGKRGGDIFFSDHVLKEINASCRQISSEKSDFKTELQRILRIIKKTKFICSVCNRSIAVPRNCEICYR